MDYHTDDIQWNASRQAVLYYSLTNQLLLSFSVHSLVIFTPEVCISAAWEYSCLNWYNKNVPVIKSIAYSVLEKKGEQPAS